MNTLAATCIALAMFFEARGEPDLGRQYVGHIVMNWSEERNITPCDVIMNKISNGHFSFSKGVGSINALEKRVLKVSQKSRTEMAAWNNAIKTGNRIAKRKCDITNGARYFNHKRKGVKFKTKLKPKSIGKQIYY